jgi:hypothetical protein
MVPDFVGLKLSEVERVCSADNWVFRVAVEPVGRNRFWIDGYNNVLILAATRAARMSALVTAGVYTREGDIDIRRDEGVSVHDGSIGPVPGRGGRDGASVLQTEVAAGGGHGPVEEGCCPW